MTLEERIKVELGEMHFSLLVQAQQIEELKARVEPKQDPPSDTEKGVDP